MYNFSKTKAATANAFLNPGIYRLKVTEVKQDKFTKGTPFLGVKFEDENGLSFIEKFQFGSEKAMEVSASRLQYLHQGFFGKECVKDFKTLEEMTAYFAKALTTKPITKTIVVGGNKNGNTVFACLPYAGFIVENEDSVTLGEYEVDSPEYKKVVKINSTVSEVAGAKNGLLNDADDSAPIGTKATKASPAKATKVAEVEPEAGADDEMPW